MKKLRIKRIVIVLIIVGIITAVFGGYTLFIKSQGKEEPKIIYDLKQVYEAFIAEEEYDSESKIRDEGKSEGEVQLSGWIPYWDFSKAVGQYKTNPASYASLSPTCYYVLTDGSLGLKNTARNSELVSLSQTNGTKLIPSISNSNADELSVILNNSDTLNKHVDAVVLEVENYGYDGIDIDYEAIKADDKEEFTHFVDSLAHKLHEKKKILTIAILWKNKFDLIIESQSESRAAQDWEAIGKVVDEFRIMAYDYTHSYEDAGPIAPVNWITSILEYAITKVDREKIVLGLPQYAYEWTVGKEGAKALVYSDVVTIKSNNTITSDKLDETDKEKQLIYESNGVKKEVWYQDDEVTQGRIDLAKSYGIYSFAFWRLGGEDPKLFKYE